MTANAIIKDAGPPVDSAAPDVTNKPVPEAGVSVFINNPTFREDLRRTDGAADCNHLQVSPFQFGSKTGVGRSLCGCGVIIFSWISCLRRLGDMGVGVPLEAVDESSPPTPVGLCITRSEVVSIRTASPRRGQSQVLLWIIV